MVGIRGTGAEGQSSREIVTLLPTTVTVLGLGGMGSALARALLRGGRNVTVWNRTPSRAGPLMVSGAVSGALANVSTSGRVDTSRWSSVSHCDQVEPGA